MLIVGDNRMSRLATCLEAAPHFQLTGDQAEAHALTQLAVVRDAYL